MITSTCMLISFTMTNGYIVGTCYIFIVAMLKELRGFGKNYITNEKNVENFESSHDIDDDFDNSISVC